MNTNRLTTRYNPGATRSHLVADIDFPKVIVSAIGGFCEGFITDLLFKDGIASPVDIGKAVVRGHHRCSG